MKGIFRYACRELLRRKRRTAGAVLSYFLIGASIVVVSALAVITRDSAQTVLWDVGAHSVAFIPRLTQHGCCIQTYATDTYDPDREGFMVNNAPTEIIPEELVTSIRQSPNIADAAPYLLFRIRSSQGEGEWLLGGIDLARPVAYSATVVAESQVTDGEFLRQGDDYMVMVEEEFAGIYGLKPGSVLRLGETDYTVKSVVNPPLRPGKANVYMTISGLRSLLQTRLDEVPLNMTNAVLVESTGAAFHDAALRDVSLIMGGGSRISSYGCSQPSALVMGINERTAWIITLIVVISMLLTATRIQYSSVIQRRHEIGVLKAIGWSDGNIISQMMTESSLYAAIGGIAGIAAGIILLRSVPGAIEIESIPVSPVIVLAGFLLPLAGSVIAGGLSSVTAVHLSVADILRKAI